MPTLEDGTPDPSVLAMRFLPRRHLLAIGALKEFLTIVDSDTGEIRERLQGHTGPIVTPGISAGGRVMVTGSGDGTVRVWSLRDARTHRLARLAKGQDGLFFSRFSSDGRLLVVGDLHGRAEIWSAIAVRR